MKLHLHPLQIQLIRRVRVILKNNDDVWQELVDLGLPALGLPLEVGGLDLGLATEVVLLRELGRALEAVPGYRETMLAADIFKLIKNQRLGEEILPNVALGELRIAVVNIWHESPLKLYSGQKINGRSAPLAAAGWNGVILRAQNETEDVLFFMELPQPGCLIEEVETLGEKATRLFFNSVDTGTELSVDDDMDEALKPAKSAARIRQAALLLGIGEAAIIAARDHVNQRQQFGQRLIDFQTVAHRLATLVGEAEGVALLLHEAAWRYDVRLPPEPSAVQSLAMATDLALNASRLAVQLHGARGLVKSGKAATAY